jgi:hypothetical protein
MVTTGADKLVALMSIISVPFAVNPKIPTPRKYMPVFVSFKKEYDGAEALPLMALNVEEDDEFNMYKN